ncbi:MAG: hypothetical protein Q9P44_10150, partial [Anaerolineae bacterium]|nr:hypothetical protein [Anaerolineae bacterium]
MSATPTISVLGGGRSEINDAHRRGGLSVVIPRKRKRGRRTLSGRSLFAITATLHEITLPAHEPVGYLAGSKLIGRAQSGDLEAVRRVWSNNAR